METFCVDRLDLEYNTWEMSQVCPFRDDGFMQPACWFRVSSNSKK